MTFDQSQNLSKILSPPVKWARKVVFYPPVDGKKKRAQEKLSVNHNKPHSDAISQRAQ